MEGVTLDVDIHSRNTESSQSFELVEQWIAQCHSTHPKCKSQPAMANASHRSRPTRLLDVSSQYDDSEDSIRLVVCPALAEGVNYVTLSYCWSVDPSFLKLLSTNLSTFQTSIPLTRLPKTFKDAVQVTRRLGYRYLWVDALCIIQDSQQDWLQEALSMTKVYASSALNLAAAASDDVNGGLFYDREPATLNGCDISIEWESLESNPVRKQTYHVSLSDPWFHMLQDSPLQNRAWAFQERLLPPRTLHFAGDQIFWECFDRCLSESNPDTDIRRTRTSHAGNHCSVKEQFASVCRDGNLKLALDVWNELTVAYSRRAVTYGSDKMVALSGIAAEMALAFKPDDYLAGIWRQSLPESLLWHTLPVAIPAQQYRAPSWSWASIDGEIAYREDFPTQVMAAKVLASTVTTTGGSFGPVIDGSLLMKGFVCKASPVALTLQRIYTCKEDFCPWKWRGTDVTMSLDEGEGYSNVIPSPNDLFFFPVVHGGLPLAKKTRENFWSSAGLVLEPIRNVTGRFRRVGVFKATGAPSTRVLEQLWSCIRKRGFRNIAHLITHVLRSWFGARHPDRDLRKVLMPPGLEEQHYRDFDGISQYTIEII